MRRLNWYAWVFNSQNHSISLSFHAWHFNLVRNRFNLRNFNLRFRILEWFFERRWHASSPTSSCMVSKNVLIQKEIQKILSKVCRRMFTYPNAHAKAWNRSSTIAMLESAYEIDIVSKRFKCSTTSVIPR